MDKFGMSFGGGPGKKELLETVEAQKKQLAQYQTRFKDVVRAYKSLLKEKEALEASLKVLTVSQEVDMGLQGPRAEPAEDGLSLHSEDSVDTAGSLTSGSTKGEAVEEDGGTESISSGEQPQQQQEGEKRLLQLKTQLATLTNSLATVTQEKSRMEASFQADRKKVKQELEELQQRMEESERLREAELQSVREQLAESKARIITQQHERAQEQGDHVLMLRELQRLLQEERGQRHDAELQLEEARQTLMEKVLAADRGADCEARLMQLAQEKKEMERSLQVAQAERDIPDPRVEELQREVADVKAHFELQLQQEIRKAAQAEERLRERSQQEESRVASLEQRVSELSEVVGASEKARQRDQQAIHKLRERILQLDMENKTLAIAASTRSSLDLSVDETNLDVNVLRDKLEKVKQLLLLASHKSPQLDKIGGGELNEPSDGEKASVTYYQQELKQLKEEFERYKARAQVVLKNKNAKDVSAAKELEEVREQLDELKEKYIGLRIHCDESAARQRRELEAQQQHEVSLQQSHRQELDRLESQQRESFLRLEEELHKQRDRASALLAEKDREVEHLRFGLLSGRNRVGSDGPVEVSSSTRSNPDDPTRDDVIARALELASPNEPTLLLYAEQLARKEVELGSLRRLKHQLEADLRQLQGKLITACQQHEEEAEELRQLLEKHGRDQRREGANLEYLKNVIYRFLTLHDAKGRQQTLGAILTILHFSPQEKQDVLRLQPHSWWGPAAR